ncbi:MAG: SCO6880 family protein, partial [Actinomycetes bacterium]
MTTDLAPVKFSRLSRRGVLLGLSPSQLATVGIAAVTLVIALYAGGTSALAGAVPIIGACTALSFLKVAGRPVVAWLPIGTVWLRRSMTGQLDYRRNFTRPRQAGTLALPGDAARLQQWEDAETGAVMVHDPHAATLTAIVAVTHPAFVLLDPAEQQRRVTGWGRVLATACRSGRLAAVQVTERTLPDSGKSLTEWWETHGTDDDTWAARTYAELIERARPTSEQHATTISVTLDMRAASRAIRAAGGGCKGAAAVLGQEMSTITAAIRSADLTPTGWLTAPDLAVVLRSAYDPDTAATLDRHPEIGRDLTTAGPVAVTESWGSLRS